MIKIESCSGTNGFAPAAIAAFDISWNLPAAPAHFDVRMVWETKGKGDTDTGIGREQRFSATEASGSHRLEVFTPEEPYSYAGKLISILWRLEVKAVPIGTEARFDFVLGPNGQGVQNAL